MKTIKIAFLIAVVLFSGCSKEQIINNPLPEKVNEIPLILSATGKKIIAKSEDPVLPQDVTTGVYVSVKNTPISSALWGNQKHTSDATGKLLSSSPINLLLTKNYDVYSYSPFQAAAKDPYAIIFPHGVDVLWAPKYAIDYVTETNHSAKLDFVHSTSQISFKIAFADDIVDREITPESLIEVSGFYEKGSLNVENGSFIPIGQTNVTLKSVGAGVPGSMTLGIGETCFVPASGTMAFNIRVIFKDIIYIGTISDTFLPGHSYVYTVTIKSSDLNLGIKGQLKDWTPVKDGFAII